ncbi:hypothetical protein LTR37_001646 [Vermiconidia calcicola]|uniref:Uncharacterized protein n=1 Tax=Vermiconidia calcicola TaxID=1690605 RepID=A0ACC3NVE7_9PEZI|nr:hypothetical protein LTR37_001646 [Vermiconidia calcicola]
MRVRSPRQRHISRIAVAILFTLFSWTALETLHIKRSLSLPPSSPPAELGGERVFISAIHWNSEAILRSNWSSAVVELARELGKDNVFVSIYESGSWDDTKGALRLLNAQLGESGVRTRIVLDATTHKEEVEKTPAEGEDGWIWTPTGKMELRRIRYLARQRNRALEPLWEMTDEKFDKILFVNDVVFTSDDVRQLLATREGDYAAACSLDFATPPEFYDTFALRDSEGSEPLMRTWPIFRSTASRRALQANDPVPMQSCWNGMVAMEASPFYQEQLSFRGISDSLAKHHLEGSECCLIHADNAISETKGVWLNPRVRVGYDDVAYRAVNQVPWPSSSQIVRGIWTNRLLRWLSTAYFRERKMADRVAEWQQGSNEEEVGAMCLVDEMQVLMPNGWAHV